METDVMRCVATFGLKSKRQFFLTVKNVSLERCIDSFYDSIIFEKERHVNKLQLLLRFIDSKKCQLHPLFNRKLNFCKPVFYGFLVPDSVDVTFSGKSCNLVAVFFCIFHDECIGFANFIISNSQNS